MQESLNELIEKAEKALSEQEREMAHAEHEPTQSVIERISRIQLCQKMIRNIRMNMLSPKNAGISLRVNQIRAVTELIRFLEQEGGTNFRGRFKQPTGAGKTVLFGVITQLIGVKTLVLVPRQNLLSNTKKEFMEMVGIPETDIGLFGAGQRELGRPITIATYQSHLSRMKRDAAYRKEVQECELVILDEAHRSLGGATKDSIDSIDDTENTEIEEEGVREDDEEISEDEEMAEEEVLSTIDQRTNQQSLKLAFTATPMLAQKDVADHFPYLIAEEKQGDLVQAGILVPYRIIQRSAVYQKEDFEGFMSEEQEAKVLTRENVYQKLTEAYASALVAYREKQEEAGYPLHGVAFCVNIAECDKFAVEAAKSGLRARVVTGREAKGKQGDDVIAAAEQALLNKEIDLIVTVNKLGEGWNFKPANAAIWARATTSPMVVIQGVGRTCRTHTDEQGRSKPYSMVFETKWSLRGSAGGYSKKPLTIAQALALNGEDPNQVCSMENGSALQYEKFAEVREDGTAEIEGKTYVNPTRYIRHQRPFLTDSNITSMMRYYPWEGKTKPPYPMVSHGRILQAYPQEDMDAFLSENQHLDGSGVVHISMRSFGDSESKVREAVYVQAYLAGKIPDPDKWLHIARSRGLQSLNTGDTKFFYTSPKQNIVDVYLREKVDEMLSQFLIPEKPIAEGVHIDTGNGETRFALCPKSSIHIPGAVKAQVMREIVEKGIAPIPYDVSEKGERNTLYWLDEIRDIVNGVIAQKNKELQDIRAQKEAKLEEQRILRVQNEEKKKKRAMPGKEKLALRNQHEYCEINQSDTPGAYRIRCGYLADLEPKTREFDGVKIFEYIPKELGRRLTQEEQFLATRGMSTMTAGPHSKVLRSEGIYLKTAVDDFIQRHIIKSNAV